MASGEAKRRNHHHHENLVPLAALISRETKAAKMEKPIVRFGQAAQSRKGEDYFLINTDCLRVPSNTSTTFSVFAIFDGHNGKAAAVFTKENLLRHVLSALPRGLSRDEWLHALPCALVSGFVKTDKEFQSRGMRERVTASGGEVGRLSIVGGVELSNLGGRLIIASDGIWDALSSEAVAKTCRGLPAELATRQVVKEALRKRGLKDDTTCIVVDIIPPENSQEPSPSPSKKHNNFFRSLLFRKKSNRLSKKLSTVSIVEELFEEGSAMLAERLGSGDYSKESTTGGMFTCAICQLDLAPSEGISVHAGSIFSTSLKPWQGPFLCIDCRDKKDAMEGKRPSGVKVI
ncbi:unnamed protein product [Thlaspi arvense]|uniref:PPM-type phosphatase domain-containing protein n=1 Tax=Thlaspi arvense TaxID=13288 RepID=A0AAU9SHN8_THLAR|nr:unnamed protein product [Thlaspi arvense]